MNVGGERREENFAMSRRTILPKCRQGAVMMSTRRMHAAFTLIEMLVVIAIIAILAGILFPVFNQVREKGRQTNCQSNLSQLAIAVKQYRSDAGAYPPAPSYNINAQRYDGGFSALFPDYVDDTSIFICPDDLTVDAVRDLAKERLYCSYNGRVASPQRNDESSWQFATGDFTDAQTGGTVTGPVRWYNYWGYTLEGVDPYEPGNTGYYPYQNSTPPWLTDRGYKYNDYPRLMNRRAPDFTIITHCPHHREFTGDTNEQLDIILQLNGSTKRVNRSAWQTPGSDGLSSFVKQYE